MKKHFITMLIVLACLMLAACGEKDKTSASTNTESSVSSIITSLIEDEEPVSVSTTVSTSDVDPEPEPEPEKEPENHDGMVRSDLTNEWIDASLENQRPVAIMVDNEKTALPHFGTSDADIVYEMINSTLNSRITRLMCIVKDWKNIEQFGNIRSTRSTNVILAPEYNAILVHDGGPSIYLKQWFSDSYCKEHLSGGFARIDNGKDKTYTEYVTAEKYYNEKKDTTYKGLISRIESAKYSTEYNKYYMGKHFTFSDTERSIADEKKATAAVDVMLPFPHNKTELHYNPDTKTYDYYEYGQLYVDALYGDEERRMSFKNVFVLCCDFVQLDEHGYLCYYIFNNSDKGYYLTDGNAIPITWKKDDIDTLMTFKDSDGKDITLNTGKTYFAIVPKDAWKSLEIK